MPKIPSVSSKRFCALLGKLGCELKRIEGDYYIFSKPGSHRPIVVPIRKDLPIYIVQNNLQTLGISRKQFVALLKQV